MESDSVSSSNTIVRRLARPPVMYVVACDCSQVEQCRDDQGRSIVLGSPTQVNTNKDCELKRSLRELRTGEAESTWDP
jgi:hypothetical protein